MPYGDEEKWVKYHWILTVEWPDGSGFVRSTNDQTEDFKAEQTYSSIYDEIIKSTMRDRSYYHDKVDYPTVLFFSLNKEETP